MSRLDRLREFYRKRKPDLTMAGIAAGAVLVAYVVASLIIWNTVSWSYAVIFAVVVFALYFIARRLMGYMVTRKEGVIKERK